jgi:maltooligosyltrehalose synthase
VIRSALVARRRRPAAFGSRAYHPLDAVGRSAGRLIAFGRGEGVDRLVAAVPRFLAGHAVSGRPATAAGLWDGTRLPLPGGWPTRWTCVLSGRSVQADPERRLPAAELFGTLPVALLLADADS